MQTSRLSLAAILLVLVTASGAFGQSGVYSINVVGYYNRNVAPGDNLIANQLGYGAGGQYSNTLNNVLTYGVADGSTFSEWDPTGHAFLPISVFSAAQTNWSINYTLNLGQGAVLHSPVATTCTFVGEVDGSIFQIDTGTLHWNPGYGAGYYLLSCPVPIDGATFEQIVGRNPTDGEWVRMLNQATQTDLTTTYHDGLGWDNGDPALAVGQAAWFDLGPAAVPEPSAGLLLAAACTLTLLRMRRQNPAGKRRQ
jgi:hypothetical protein